MGIFRYFLAICVVLAHTPYIDWYSKPFDGNGGIPVQAFFVISGFYMSLIYEKYQLTATTPTNLKNFYLARALRIYPVYFACLICTFLFLSNGITPPEPFRVPAHAMDIIHTLNSKMAYIFENVFIFGQSLIRFYSFDATTGSFGFAPLMIHQVPGTMACGFTMLGQAWTLSLELTFYLLVPFILHRSVRLILLVCLASVMLRLMLYQGAIDNYNFQNAFFPSVLGTFLLGALSHRIIYPLVRDRSNTFKKIAGWATIGFIAFYAMHIYHKIGNIQLKFWLFIAFIPLILPFLFCCFKDSKLDRNIGEMSFPIYMAQYLGMALVLKFLDVKYIGYYNVLLDNLIGLALLFVIVRPIDRYRHAHFLKHKARREALESKNLYSSPQTAGA